MTMSDEFDDAVEPVARRHGLQADSTVPFHPTAPRLVSRLYAYADRPLRARLLACLVRPLGPLGLVAVAAGAFGALLQRGEGIKVAIDDVARYSNEQILELARFVEQVSPEALRQFAALLADNPVGTAAFSASAALLLQVLQQPRRQR
jgi:hypothetical protein